MKEYKPRKTYNITSDIIIPALSAVLYMGIVWVIFAVFAVASSLSGRP